MELSEAALHSEPLSFRFAGIERLYGKTGLQKLNNAHVAIIGLGGVGSWIVESLVRSGVGRLTLVDFDEVCISNTNRQIHAVTGNIGRMKTKVLQERAEAIHPAVQIHLIEEAFNLETEELIFAQPYDVVIDAIDQGHKKLFLAQACLKRGIPQVIVGSAGGRHDPTQIKTGDLAESYEDPLLAILRKDLRQQAGLPRKKKGPMGIQSVFSAEKPRYPVSENCETAFSDTKPESFKKPLDCATGFGTVSHVTGTFGFMASHLAIKYIIGA